MAMKKKSDVLTEPRFGYLGHDGLPRKPSFQDILKELLYVLDVSANPTHSLTALNFIFQLSTLVAFLVYCFLFFSAGSLIFMLITIFVLGTIYNTIWYHRYCSHKSFQFARSWFVKLFLWTNPLAFVFREETYAIPHRVHHQRTDNAGDPYGPHLGWLATFLAPELTQRTNSDVSEERFQSLKRNIRHIGLYTHTYAQFKETGNIEHFGHYAARVVFSHLFWIVFILILGGTSYLSAYFSAIFIITVLIRDFNWRGHGGNFRRIKKAGWEFDSSSHALNQRFYGYIASEWHDNHHKYPMSANNGFLPGQVDSAFRMIKLMHRVGIIQSYVDARLVFEKEHLAFSVAA